MKIFKSQTQVNVKPKNKTDVVRLEDIEELRASSTLKFETDVKGKCTDVLHPIMTDDGKISTESYMIPVQHNLGTNKYQIEISQKIDDVFYNVITDVVLDDNDPNNLAWLVFGKYQTVNDIYHVRIYST